MPNAAWRLVWALETLKDEHDHILVDGLMDHVRPPSGDELAHLSKLPFDQEQVRANLGFSDYVPKTRIAEVVEVLAEMKRSKQRKTASVIADTSIAGRCPRCGNPLKEASVKRDFGVSYCSLCKVVVPPEQSV